MAIEFIGNIFSSDNSDLVVEHFAQKNLAGHLAMLLDGENAGIKKSVLWIYSNMVTCTTQSQSEKQIEAFFQEAPIQKISQLCYDGDNNDVKVEAAWVLSNIVNCGSQYQAKTVFEMSQIDSENHE